MILILNTYEETLLYTLLIDFCQGRTRVAGYKHGPQNPNASLDVFTVLFTGDCWRKMIAFAGYFKIKLQS